MAIAFDAASSGKATATSVTVAHTCSGGQRALLACISTETNDTVTGVTYAGVAMTKIGSSVQNSGNAAWVSLWILTGPATGSNNIVASHSDGAKTIALAAASYTGVRQTNQPNASSSATTQAVSVTSTVDNCWAVMASQADTTPTTAGANTTRRAEGTTWGNTLFDSNAAVSPAGARTLNQGNGTAWASVIAAIAPATPSMLAVF